MTPILADALTLTNGIEIGGFVILIGTIILAAGRLLQKQEDNTTKTEANGVKTDSALAMLTDMKLSSAVKDERTHGRIKSLEDWRSDVKANERSASGMTAVKTCPTCSSKPSLPPKD